MRVFDRIMGGAWALCLVWTGNVIYYHFPPGDTTLMFCYLILTIAIDFAFRGCKE